MSPVLDRRAFLRLAAGAGLGASLGGFACAPAARPNVLFIAIDDLNDWVGCLKGHPQTRTPNLDRLAARATLFTRAFSDGVNCPGSRTAAMTGLAPWHTEIYGFNPPMREVLPDVVTLPEYFAAHGYRTLGVGKIFHLPEAESWQEYHLPEQPPLDPYRIRRDEFGFSDGSSDDWGPLDIPDKLMFDSRVARWASRHLAEPQEKPFFLGVGFLRPHLPWLVPKRYFKPFPPEKVRLPKVQPHDMNDTSRWAGQRAKKDTHRKVLEAGQWRHAVASYLASIYFMDTQLGKVLDALDAGPHRDNTVIALWSDHGYLLGHKGAWHKFVLWAQATRIPMIVALPGQTEGRVCGRPVTPLHFYPTLADLCRLPAKPGLDGRSLRPLLEDPESAWGTMAVSAMDCGSFAVRDERWDYIRYTNGDRELYDQQQDPHEFRNLLRHGGDVPEVVARLDPHVPKDTCG